jgi:hypothetical protein
MRAGSYEKPLCVRFKASAILAQLVYGGKVLLTNLRALRGRVSLAELRERFRPSIPLKDVRLAEGWHLDDKHRIVPRWRRRETSSYAAPLRLHANPSAPIITSKAVEGSGMVATRKPTPAL